MRAGESVTFNYTGSVYPYEVESSGLYKIEVWGAQGDAYGGYAVGYKKLRRGQTLYIAVGGQGERTNPYTSGGDHINSGGWNGGGYGRNAGNSENTTTYRYGGGGGGATHIALVDGTLASIGYDSFVTQGNGLIVAGGGGGSTTDMYRVISASGGSGGGTNGGSAGGSGGTQSSGYAFGQGGNAPTIYRGGGGGGLYGGYAGTGDYPNCAGGGGSGYVGGVPSITYQGETYAPSMSNGQRSGNGQAKLTKMGGATVYYGEKECTVMLGDEEIDDIYFGDIVLG